MCCEVVLYTLALKILINVQRCFVALGMYKAEGSVTQANIYKLFN